MSCLIPGESLKVNSKAFEVISSQIKARLLNKDQANNEAQFVYQKKVSNKRNGEETKVDSLPEAKTNGEKSDPNVLSKFLITDRYDAENFLKIKEGIKVKLVTYEIQKELHRGHYSTELKRWQKKLRGYRDYEQSITKVTTHPKGKEELENRKLYNLKQKIASNIPEPGEKPTRYLRSEIRQPDHIDIYTLDIWKFKEVQTFIGLFFDHYKNFQEIQNKLPDKKTHEIIALYDLMNPILSLKKFYKKAKQKPSALRKEFLKSVLPKIKEKLLFILKDLILLSCANQTVIPLGEVKFSRRDLISCFTADHI